MTFQETLSQLRKARGLSQEALAAQIGVSRQAVSKWETGDASPDLNKLLALADQLEVSLDTLCGRESPAGSSCPIPPSAPAERPAARRRLPLILCGLLAVCLLGTGLWVWSRRNLVPSESAPAESTLPESFSVAAVSFSGKSSRTVAYQFALSVSDGAGLCQILFTAPDGQVFPFAVSERDGVCTGTADLPNGTGPYAVTVSISDGSGSRSLVIAQDLTFSAGDAGWTPVEDAP